MPKNIEFQQSKRKVEDSSQDYQSESQAQNKQELIDLQMQKIKQELRNMPYQLIIKHRQLQNTPKNTQKTPKIKKSGLNKAKVVKNKPINKQPKDKQAPQQVGIREKTIRHDKPVFQSTKQKSIDPRFESYAGNYNPDMAMKSYNFIPKIQEAEISELKSRLKHKHKRGARLNSQQENTLMKQYNKITNEYKQGKLIQVQKNTKQELRQKHGPDFHIKKNVFRQQFQKKKLANMSEADRARKEKEKIVQQRRQQQSQKRKTLKQANSGNGS